MRRIHLGVTAVEDPDEFHVHPNSNSNNSNFISKVKVSGDMVAYAGGGALDAASRVAVVISPERAVVEVL